MLKDRLYIAILWLGIKLSQGCRATARIVMDRKFRFALYLAERVHDSNETKFVGCLIDPLSSRYCLEHTVGPWGRPFEGAQGFFFPGLGQIHCGALN